MLLAAPDTPSSTLPSETPLSVAGFIPTRRPSDLDPEREQPETPYGVRRAEKGWGLKLAVLLVVAALCIAFAGLLWALIF